MNRLALSRVATILVPLSIPLIALPAGAFAQTSPSASATGAAPAMSKQVSAEVEQHIKQLHDELHITPAQQAQWGQFAAVMRSNAAQMSQAFTERGSRLGAMNAAENMESYARLAQLHAADMQRLASAFQSLYNTFPEQQKQAADAVFRQSSEQRMAHRR